MHLLIPKITRVAARMSAVCPFCELPAIIALVAGKPIVVSGCSHALRECEVVEKKINVGFVPDSDSKS